MKKLYVFLGRLFPENIRNKVKNMLLEAELKLVPEEFLGFSVIFSLLLGLAGFSVSIIFLNNMIYSLIIFISISFGFAFFSYGSILLIIDRKIKFIEEVLPDVLSLTAANIRSGIPPDRALLLSAKPEFGYLEKYIKEAAKKSLAGESIESALSLIPKKIKSNVLERAVMLINEGLRYGGELASVLEEVASEIRDLHLLKKEIKSVVMMYTMFIFIAAVIGSPLLYAVSTFMTETMTKFGSVVTPVETGYQTFGIRTTITPDFLFHFSLAAIVINIIFAGFILGLIYQGKEKRGIKYIPIMLLISLSLFFIIRSAISSMIGAII